MIDLIEENLGIFKKNFEIFVAETLKIWGLSVETLKNLGYYIEDNFGFL